MKFFLSADSGENLLSGSDSEHTNVYSKLKREVDSWRPFAEALREEDRVIFREMLNSVSASYSEAIERAERGYDTEALLMSIIMYQQKTINWLTVLLKRTQNEVRR